MSDMPERIWATRLNEPQRKHAWGDWDDTEQTDGVEYVRAGHVNELVAVAYDAGFYSVVGGEGEYAPPADATAALAARDARVREAALKEAADIAKHIEAEAAKALEMAIELNEDHSIRTGAASYQKSAGVVERRILALIAKDTTNG